MNHIVFLIILSCLRCCHALLCWLTLGVAVVAVPAQAQVQDPSVLAALQTTQQWLDQAVRDGTRADTAALRPEVSMGTLDARLRLAPCARIEPYLPVNTKLWGKSRIGLRCLEGSSKWNVFLPVTVKAWGLAWVLKSPVSAGAVLQVADAILAEVDWASESSPIVAQAGRWIGQVAAHPLPAGMPVRQAMLRPAAVFAAGASVRVLAQGKGFQISAQGQALSAGVIGQSTRVHTEGGNTVTGTVIDAHTVQVQL